MPMKIMVRFTVTSFYIAALWTVFFF